MIYIFAETHKILAKSLHENLRATYNIELNEERMMWGSVIPDLFPKYKMKRHYLDDSLNFVTNEIVSLIFVSRFMNLNDSGQFLTKKLFSRKLGIISHYLADYCCYVHANNLSFYNSLVKHVQYEKLLNEVAKTHSFEDVELTTPEIDLNATQILKLKELVADQIVSIVDEYKTQANSCETDLNFALALNNRIGSFVLDVLIATQEAPQTAVPTLVY